MIELYEYEPPDGTELLTTWLQPLGPTDTERPSDAPLPFRTVRRIGGSDDGYIDKGLYAIHCITATEEQAHTEGALTHRRIEGLVSRFAPPQPVAISSGTVYANDLSCNDQTVVLWADDYTEWAWVGVYRMDLRLAAIHDDA